MLEKGESYILFLKDVGHDFHNKNGKIVYEEVNDTSRYRLLDDGTAEIRYMETEYSESELQELSIEQNDEYLNRYIPPTTLIALEEEIYLGLE